MVKVQSQSSRDTRFELEYMGDAHGFTYDSYESLVSTGLTTRERVAEEYEAAVRNALQDDFPVYDLEVDFFGVQGGSPVGKAVSAPDTVEWVLDQEYDVSQVGAQIGYVILWLDDTKQAYTEDNFDQLVRQAAEALEDAEIGVYAFDIMLADELYFGRPVFHFEKRILKSELE